MAIYHLSAKVISRSVGQSAVAAAAYRSASVLTDERTGRTCDYTRKERVDHTEIMAPEHTPAWMRDRGQLWNAVEKAEKRKDAQLAREVEVSLPRELNREQQIELVREFVLAEFVERGMIADVAIHAPPAKDGEEQPHAHILLTQRVLTAEGFGGKERAWNDKEMLGGWRERWAAKANAALENAGRSERIDHRSLRDQGIDREPTIHHGAAVDRMETAGRATDRGDALVRILARNEQRSAPVRDDPRAWRQTDRRHPSERMIERPATRPDRRRENPRHDHRSWVAPQARQTRQEWPAVVREDRGWKKTRPQQQPHQTRQEWRSRKGLSWDQVQDIHRGRERANDWLVWAGVTKEAVPHDHPARAHSRLADLTRSETDRRRAEARQDRGIPEASPGIGRSVEAGFDPREGHPDRAGTRHDLGRDQGAAPAARPSLWSSIKGLASEVAEGWQERQQTAAAARQAAELAALRARYEVRMDDGLHGRYPETRDFTDHRVTPEGRHVSYIPERPRIWDRQGGDEGHGSWAPAAIVARLMTIRLFADLIAEKLVAHDQHIAKKLVAHDQTAAAQEMRAAREAGLARLGSPNESAFLVR